MKNFREAEYGVLHLGPAISYRDTVTGRFMKGHVPANKGKRWNDFMSKQAQENSARGWKNIDLHRCKGGGERSGRPKKAVVAVTDEGRIKMFDFTLDAALWVGGSRHNVARCCRLNSLHKANTDHKYMGVRFYFLSDNNWLCKKQ